MEKYQVTKTIRMGLSLKKSVKKNPSHTELLTLVDRSEENIKANIPDRSSLNEKEMVNAVIEFIAFAKKYLADWTIIHERMDQIAFTKEYYKKIAVKACFNWFWERRDRRTQRYIKQPQSQIVKASSLRSIYMGRQRNEYILIYWNDNLKKIKQQLRNFELILNQYEQAVNNPGKSHLKPQLVDFRKSFLSITSLLNETLIPLNEGSICFPDLVKLTDDERNKIVWDFVLGESKDERLELAEKLKEIKTYFEDNGGYVPFGRVTLNPYTVDQKLHKFNDEIESLIKKLDIVTLCKTFVKMNDEEVQRYLEFPKQSKTKLLRDRNNLTLAAQAFKYKPIPLSVRFMLAQYIEEKYQLNRKDVLRVFEQIGKMRNPAKEYADLINKEEFDLNHYPLKVAFDYAWESLANDMHNPSDKFSKEHCKKFLENIFNVNITDGKFKLYADLLAIRKNLATLEYSYPNDREEFTNNIQKIAATINFDKDERQNRQYINTLLEWINLSKDQQNQLKKERNQKYKDFEEAKQKLGLFRGGLKNRFRVHQELTNQFKDIAFDFGKSFADLRDKLREENELSKINFFGIIIEDSNRDRYVLLQDINKVANINTLLQNETSGSLMAYHVKSLTSKTLMKFRRNYNKYKNFHITSELEKTDPAYIIACLQNSTMAEKQKWEEFAWDFTKCDNIEKIEKELDSQAYILKPGKTTYDAIEKLIASGNYFLMPFVNQDITSVTRKAKNQFSKDWDMIFDKGTDFRLHPEFKITYRQPTPDYPKPGKKRYSRFQMIAHLGCEYIPKSAEYLSKKNQLKNFNNPKDQEKHVDEFNAQINSNILNKDYYILGIDRGLTQLVTLCVLNKNGIIQKDFPIYTRTFSDKQWRHSVLEYRSILDLSNLKVETTIEGKQVLVDLSRVPLKNNVENRQKIKLKQLAYIRKLQYQMQNNEEKVLTFIEQNKTKADIEANIRELITSYKEGGKYEDLPLDKIDDLLTQFKELCNNGDEKSKRELCELDAADTLKSGIVANMIGVIAYLLREYNYNYQAYISVENLCRAFGFSKDGLTGFTLESTNINPDVDFKEQENSTLAGLGTYHFFEMQLLKKLFCIQQEDNILHLVPAFRSVDNYESIRKLTKKEKDVEYTCKPFGIVHFVDPKYTSKRCPDCSGTNVSRVKNIITCKNDNCRYVTDGKHSSKFKKNKNIELITNGDENGAYHIALKTWENLNKIKS